MSVTSPVFPTQLDERFSSGKLITYYHRQGRVNFTTCPPWVDPGDGSTSPPVPHGWILGTGQLHHLSPMGGSWGRVNFTTCPTWVEPGDGSTSPLVLPWVDPGDGSTSPLVPHGVEPGDGSTSPLVLPGETLPQLNHLYWREPGDGSTTPLVPLG